MLSSSRPFRRATVAALAGGLVASGVLTALATTAVSTATAAPSARTTHAARSLPTCPSSSIVAWLNTAGQGTAGAVVYELQFTNISGHACSLSGPPKVVAVDHAGNQLGKAASRSGAHLPITVPKDGQQSVQAMLQIEEAGNFPASSCHPTWAAGLKVTPPGSSTATTIPFPFMACAKASGPVYMFVHRVKKES